MRRSTALSVVLSSLALLAFVPASTLAASVPADGAAAVSPSPVVVPDAVPAVGSPAEEAPAPDVARDDDAEAFLRSLEGTSGAEDRYACEGYLVCTRNLDCVIFYDLNCPTGSNPACSNPSGIACHGYCYCD